MKPSELFSLEGKVAMVTGGGGGIGSKLAGALCEAGAEIAIVDRSGSHLKSSCSLVEALGKQPLSLSADLTKAEEAEQAVADTVERFGSLDIVINAIGGGAGNVLFDAQEYPMDAWEWIFDLNLTTTLLATQAAVKAMIAGGKGGKVLNISSVRGQLGINAGYSAYVAAKGAIDSLTRQWATEWAKHNITVNAITPPFVDTPQVAMLLDDPDFKAGIVSRVPLGRVGTPEDLMGPVLMFCSDASRFVTGQILTIDGGLTATQ
jgi:gluconate 5-dehydrogenase